MNNVLYKLVFKKTKENGFSLVEIVVVLSILSTLSAITIPNILRTIKLNRLDEAKILMDSYAAECLNEYRLGSDLSNVSPISYSEKKINNLGLKKTNGSNCAKFSIEPSISDNLLYQFDFRIGSDSGNIVKTATPASNESSKKSCELWAGDLCTSNQASKTAWDNIFNLEKSKTTCDTNFFNWKKTLPSGSYNTWDNDLNSCTKKMWVHKNYIADSETKYLSIKANEECLEAKKPFSNHTGEQYIAACQKTFYFYKGIDMGSNAFMQKKLIEEDEANCMVNREEKRLSSSNGKYIGEESSGKCGDYFWICNKRILTSLDQWKESNCYTP